MSSRWNSAVGALPITTTLPARCGRQSSSAAADRVLPSSLARCGTDASPSVQITGLSAGSRARVMPSATMPRVAENRRTAGQRGTAGRTPHRARSAGRRLRRPSPHAWITRHREFFEVGGDAGKVGFGADRRKGLAIDLLTVAKGSQSWGRLRTGRCRNAPACSIVRWCAMQWPKPGATSSRSRRYRS